MNSFISNKLFLDSETVAEQLRSARQEKKIKLETAAKKLNINYKYLEALEKGQMEKLPKGVYGKNFLREYAIFLGLDYGELERIFAEELEGSKSEEPEKLFSHQKVKARHFLAAPRIIKNFVIVISVVACLVYLGIAVKKIIAPPDLYIENPPDNFITEDKAVTIIGVTEAEAQILVNGENVLTDENGRFLKEVSLKNGLNTITISAKKKYGRVNSIQKQVLVK